MKKAIEKWTKFRRLPTFAQLDMLLTRQWDLGSDPSGAVETARHISGLLTIKAAEVDLERDFHVVSHAAEVFWDSKAFEDAQRLGDLWRQTVTAVCDERDLDPTEFRIWSAILSARIAHRLRDYRAAVGYAKMAITDIRKEAGGVAALHSILHLGASNPILEAYCGALAIGIPAGRLHFSKKPALRAQFLDQWVDEAKMILDRDMPPRLLRIHALVSQTHYAISERPKTPELEKWLNRLERFDDIVRPRHQRGQSTKRLRNIARARFDGDVARELEETEQAHDDLRFLPRHIDVLTANKWWAVPAIQS